MIILHIKRIYSTDFRCLHRVDEQRQISRGINAAITCSRILTVHHISKVSLGEAIESHK